MTQKGHKYRIFVMSLVILEFPVHPGFAANNSFDRLLTFLQSVQRDDALSGDGV